MMGHENITVFLQSKGLVQQRPCKIQNTICIMKRSLLPEISFPAASKDAQQVIHRDLKVNQDPPPAPALPTFTPH